MQVYVVVERWERGDVIYGIATTPEIADHIVEQLRASGLLDNVPGVTSHVVISELTLDVFHKEGA